MKIKLRNGFSMAELLIVLSIIGVVAVMTITSLMISGEGKVKGAALGRSVEAIESGCQGLIQFANEKNSDGVIFTGHSQITKKDIGESDSTLIIDKNSLFKNASQFFGASPADTPKYTITSYDGGTAFPKLDSFAQSFAVSTKFGAYYGVAIPTSNESGTDDPVVESILIDVNGPKAPNRYGRDVFLFGLTDRCHMIPAGTERLSNYKPFSIPTESAGCDKNITNGLSCTSRVVKNGYKIDY